MYAKLNARLLPMERGERFEDPLYKALERHELGGVSGGGTCQSEDGEVVYCGLDVDLVDLVRGIPFVTRFLTQCGAPKGSALLYEANGTQLEASFGRLEGLALYLNGVDLPAPVYAECDVNIVLDMLEKLLGEHGSRWSHWQGPRETALYCYGDSFDMMRERIIGFVAEYPLCQKSRIVRIA